MKSDSSLVSGEEIYIKNNEVVTTLGMIVHRWLLDSSRKTQQALNA